MNRLLKRSVIKIPTDRYYEWTDRYYEWTDEYYELINKYYES